MLDLVLRIRERHRGFFTALSYIGPVVTLGFVGRVWSQSSNTATETRDWQRAVDHRFDRIEAQIVDDRLNRIEAEIKELRAHLPDSAPDSVTVDTTSQ